MSLRIGLIGAGGMGARHAANIQSQLPRARLVALFDPDRDRAAAVAADLGVPIAAEAVDLIAQDDVDAVVIASPDETHAGLATECLRVGKPVLCEKPLARSRQDAWEIVAREVELGRRLVALGFMRRFDPYHLAVKTAVAEGDIGRPIAVKGVHRTVDLPPGYGPDFAISASAVHDIDAARWMLAEEITEIRAVGRRVSPVLPAGTLDLVFLEATFTRGCLGFFEIFQTAGYSYEVVAEVMGNKGLVSSSSPPAVRLPPGHPRSPTRALDWFARFEQAYVEEIRAFSNSVSDSLDFSGATAWDGFVSVAAADAALASLESGRPEPVDLPGKPDLYRVA